MHQNILATVSVFDFILQANLCNLITNYIYCHSGLVTSVFKQCTCKHKKLHFQSLQQWISQKKHEGLRRTLFKGSHYLVFCVNATGV